jgi:hypothetical protein
MIAVEDKWRARFTWTSDDGSRKILKCYTLEDMSLEEAEEDFREFIHKALTTGK